MLGFLFHKKRDEVKRILNGRMNRTFLQTLNPEEVRGSRRGAFTEVVWVVPCNDTATADFASVFPAVTKDLSAQGICLLHYGPITEPRVIIGLRDETDPRFLLCTRTHCTAIGSGFYQIGLHPDEVILIRNQAIDLMRETLARYEAPAEELAAAM